MPDSSALSMPGALANANAVKTALANSVLHLFQAGFVPTPTSTLADFQAVEADFDGYAELTIATWNNPVLAGTGYAIYAPLQTFRWTHDTDDVGNQIGGAFLVTAGGALHSYQIFDPTRPCQGPDQAVIVQSLEVFPAG